ncbi:MAG: hypothetical protein ACREE7_03785, partial [Dongiaceae bacterium]
MSVIAVIVSIGWIALALFYVNRRIGWQNLYTLSPGELGGIIAGVIAPVALLGVLAVLERRGLEEARNRALLRDQLEALTDTASEALDHAVTVTGEMKRQAEALHDSSSDATRAIESTGLAFRQHSKDLAESAVTLTNAVNEIKDLLAAQSTDVVGLSQRLADQRVALAESARAETASLAQTVAGAAQGVADTVKAQAEQIAALVERTAAQGLRLQTAFGDQAKELG